MKNVSKQCLQYFSQDCICGNSYFLSFFEQIAFELDGEIHGPLSIEKFDR